MQALDRIPPLHPDMTEAWPHNSDGTPAEVVGVNPFNGRPIGLLRRDRSRSVEDKDPATGEPRMRRHQNTGEPMYQLRKRQNYVEEFYFFLESPGNGNVMIVKCPSPDELRKEYAEYQRKQQAKNLVPEIAEALIGMGITTGAVWLRFTAIGRDLDVVDLACTAFL